MSRVVNARFDLYSYALWALPGLDFLWRGIVRAWRRGAADKGDWGTIKLADVWPTVSCPWRLPVASRRERHTHRKHSLPLVRYDGTVVNDV